MEFQAAALYGGAITTSLPTTFDNASRFRPIPDNQEVFVETRNGATPINVIFEVLEQAPQADGLDAVQYHLDDVRDAGDRGRVLDRRQEMLERMTTTPAYSALGTFVRRQDGGTDFTAVIALLARLNAQEADILVLVHVPHVNTVTSESDLDLAAPTAELVTGLNVAGEICKTLEVKDWGLFGA